MTTYAPVYPHDPLVEVFPNVFLLHGSIGLGPGMSMNRNMVVFREEDALTLVNPVRVEPEILQPLGKVRDLVRLGDFHGLDDRYYQDTYGATLWCQLGQSIYPVSADEVTSLTPNGPLPISSAKLFAFENAAYPEAAILHEKTGLLVTTDSLQNHTDWSYVSFITRLFLCVVGLRGGLVIGGPWLKRVGSAGGDLRADFARLLQLDFKHLVGAHGTLLRDHAKREVERVVADRFE